MARLVTIGIPVYKRLDYLPYALRSVARQDYPEIELIVSDNGGIGSRVLEMVQSNYPKPFRYRRNAEAVSSDKHFNQIISASSGEYFVLLCDDDEISPNFVSELAPLLDQNPEVSLAISAQEIIDERGIVLKRYAERLPISLSGTELIRAAWKTQAYGFQCFVTHMSRTEDLRGVGGYPDFTGATHDDDAVLIKLSLGRSVVFSDRCTFRWRVYNESLGWSIAIDELAAASREFLFFLDSDPVIQSFAAAHRLAWKQAKGDIVGMVFDTYFKRWRGIYRERMPRFKWMTAAFAMPANYDYYRQVASTLISVGWAFLVERLRRWFTLPTAHH